MILLLKLLFSQFIKAAGEFLAFCVKHWRIILPCLMVGLTYLAFNRVVNQRDDARHELAQHIEADQAAAEKRKQENLQKEIAVQRNFNALMANHTATINQLRNDNAKLKGEKVALQGTAADLERANRNWRQRVQLDLAAAAARMSSLPGTAGDPAESGGDCDAAITRSAYETLDLACSVTTADYNALWQAWDEACKFHGCKPHEGAPMVK